MSGNAESNTQVVRQAYDNFKTGNVPALLAQLTADADWHLPKIENARISGPRRGSAQIGEFFTALGEDQDTLAFEPREFIAQGDEVVVLGHYAWRVKQTGKQFDSDFAHVFTVRDGQVVRFREFLDTAVAAEAYRN
jgi:uncharacterized protein